MASITSFYKYETELKFYEGFIYGVEVTTKENGNVYCKFSIPLKKEKEEEAKWLNCLIFDDALCVKFTNQCKRGSKVLVGGYFRLTEAADGNEYVNFVVKTYTYLKDAKPKAEAMG